MSPVAPCRKPACRSTPLVSSRTWSRTSSCPSFLLTSSYLSESAAALVAAGPTRQRFIFDLDLVLAALGPLSLRIATLTDRRAALCTAVRSITAML